MNQFGHQHKLINIFTLNIKKKKNLKLQNLEEKYSRDLLLFIYLQWISHGIYNIKQNLINHINHQEN